MNEYFTYLNGQFEKLSLRELVLFPRDSIWSGRLGTGIFGSPDCPSGNLGPKNEREVLLAIGDEGLHKLIDLGFVTCPVCRPEKRDYFWETAQPAVIEKYGISCLENFLDRKLIPFNAANLQWEEILLITGGTPNRLYLSRGWPEKDLQKLEQRFASQGFKLSPVGIYDSNAPGRFREYHFKRLITSPSSTLSK